MALIKFLDKNEIRRQMELTEEELHQIKRTTCMKYKIMRIRAKLSFLAFQKNQTIFELLLTQILKSYVLMAKMKEDEIGDTHDQFELFRMNDHTF